MGHEGEAADLALNALHRLAALGDEARGPGSSTLAQIHQAQFESHQSLGSGIVKLTSQAPSLVLLRAEHPSINTPALTLELMELGHFLGADEHVLFAVNRQRRKTNIIVATAKRPGSEVNTVKSSPCT